MIKSQKIKDSITSRSVVYDPSFNYSAVCTNQPSSITDYVLAKSNFRQSQISETQLLDSQLTLNKYGQIILCGKGIIRDLSVHPSQEQLFSEKQSKLELNINDLQNRSPYSQQHSRSGSKQEFQKLQVEGVQEDSSSSADDNKVQQRMKYWKQQLGQSNSIDQNRVQFQDPQSYQALTNQYQQVDIVDDFNEQEAYDPMNQLEKSCSVIHRYCQESESQTDAVTSQSGSVITGNSNQKPESNNSEEQSQTQAGNIVSVIEVINAESQNFSAPQSMQDLVLMKQKCRKINQQQEQSALRQSKQISSNPSVQAEEQQLSTSKDVFFLQNIESLGQVARKDGVSDSQSAKAQKLAQLEKVRKRLLIKGESLKLDHVVSKYGQNATNSKPKLQKKPGFDSSRFLNPKEAARKRQSGPISCYTDLIRQLQQDEMLQQKLQNLRNDQDVIWLRNENNVSFTSGKGNAQNKNVNQIAPGCELDKYSADVQDFIHNQQHMFSYRTKFVAYQPHWLDVRSANDLEEQVKRDEAEDQQLKQMVARERMKSLPPARVSQAGRDTGAGNSNYFQVAYEKMFEDMFAEPGVEDHEETQVSANQSALEKQKSLKFNDISPDQLLGKDQQSNQSADFLGLSYIASPLVKMKTTAKCETVSKYLQLGLLQQLVIFTPYQIYAHYLKNQKSQSLLEILLCLIELPDNFRDTVLNQYSYFQHEYATDFQQRLVASLGSQFGSAQKMAHKFIFGSGKQQIMNQLLRLANRMNYVSALDVIALLWFAIPVTQY